MEITPMIAVNGGREVEVFRCHPGGRDVLMVFGSPSQAPALVPAMHEDGNPDSITLDRDADPDTADCMVLVVRRGHGEEDAAALGSELAARRAANGEGKEGPKPLRFTGNDFPLTEAEEHLITALRSGAFPTPTVEDPRFTEDALRDGVKPEDLECMRREWAASWADLTGRVRALFGESPAQEPGGRWGVPR